MEGALLTWYQALQLLALGPCLFMLFFLGLAVRRLTQTFVPILYFLALICSFLTPFLEVFHFPAQWHGVLLMGESLIPALSFLLIIQFLTGKIPSAVYWAILAVPLIGGSSIVYATMIAKGEICVREHICALPATFWQLYEIFSASMTFLLTIAVFHRLSRSMEGNESQRKHKYAMVVALVVLNLAGLCINLALVNGYIAAARAEFATTILHIGFIYLVLTSMFRVFDKSFEIAYERLPSVTRPLNSRDLALADSIRALLEQDKLYRTMEMNREKLALKLAVNENTLSRVINQHFSRNLSMLLNQYRVAEAKERLEKEETAVTIIAFEVGFSSIPSFNRVFRQVVGMSPSEYRSSFQPDEKA